MLYCYNIIIGTTSNDMVVRGTTGTTDITTTSIMTSVELTSEIFNCKFNVTLCIISTILL